MRPTRRGLVWQFLFWQPCRSLLRIHVLSERSDRGDAQMEKHLERAYSPIDVARWLAEAGFRLRGVHDEATAALAAHCTPRMLFVAQRNSRN